MTDKKGVYIHIPFCRSKCKYCDFVSYPDRYGCVEKYFDRIISEIRDHSSCPVDTVYIGGGTPSSVDSKFITRTLEAVYKNFRVAEDAEITIEVNPDSVEPEKLYAYKKSGINRISMGAQSFSDDELAFLGRLHTAQAVYDKYVLIRDAGFDNVNLDLMFGLPGQTEKSLESSIQALLRLAPEHISCYGLKIEEGTPLCREQSKGKLIMPDDDFFADMYDFICEHLIKAGYIQYEISNFSLPGRCSLHNNKYWQCDEYIGIGAGAASYLDGVRSKNTNELLEYKSRVEEVLSFEDKMSEFVIFGLRMTDKGINTDEFYVRFGRDISDVFGEQLEKHKNFISREGEVLKLKRGAYYISNSILADFMC